jgi:hypothetical protein
MSARIKENIIAIPTTERIIASYEPSAVMIIPVTSKMAPMAASIFIKVLIFNERYSGCGLLGSVWLPHFLVIESLLNVLQFKVTIVCA